MTLTNRLMPCLLVTLVFSSACGASDREDSGSDPVDAGPKCASVERYTLHEARRSINEFDCKLVDDHVVEICTQKGYDGVLWSEQDQTDSVTPEKNLTGVPMYVSYDYPDASTGWKVSVTRSVTHGGDGSLSGKGTRSVMSGGGSSYTLHCYIEYDVTLTPITSGGP